MNNTCSIDSSHECSIRPWILAARPKTLVAGVAPVMLGSVLAFYFGAFQIIPATLCLLFSVLVQIGCNFANDYYDHANDVDTEERVGFARMVNSGLISPCAMKKAAYLVLATALVVGSALIFYGGWGLLIVGITSVICAIAYTAGPFPLGYHGLGDLFVFIFFGLVATVFTFYVQAHHFRPEVFIVAAGCGLLAANIRLVNDMRDRETDAKAGKKTSAVRFGRTFCSLQYHFSNIVALVIVPTCLVMEYNFSVWTTLCAITVFPALTVSKKIAHCKTGHDYNHLLEKTAKLLFLNSTILSLSIIMSSFPELVAYGTYFFTNK